MKRLLFVLVVIWAMCLLTISATPQVKSATWEYKIEPKCSEEKKLTALAAEGWELVGFSISEAGLGENWRCIFKRPKA